MRGHHTCGQLLRLCPQGSEAQRLAIARTIALTRHECKHCSPLAQADGSGKELSTPAAPVGTNLAAQFSVTWWDVAPSMIGERQADAYKAAILKQLPAGAPLPAAAGAWQGQLAAGMHHCAARLGQQDATVRLRACTPCPVVHCLPTCLPTCPLSRQPRFMHILQAPACTSRQ